MNFINWGEETPEQKEARRRYEEEQALYEQAVRYSRMTGSMSGAAGSGAAPAQSPTITISVLGRDHVTFGFQNPTHSLLSIRVDWGDESDPTEIETTDGVIFIDHTYASEGNWQIQIQSEDFSPITYALFTNAGIYTITGLHWLTQVQELALYNNNLIAFDLEAPWTAPLNGLYLGNNQLSEFNPSYPLPSTLSSLDLSNNQLTSIDLTHPLPANLSSLDISYNQLTGFEVPTPYPTASNLYLYLYNNNFNDSSPFTVLPSTQYLDLHGNDYTSFNVDFSGFTNLNYLLMYQCSNLVEFNPIGLPPNLSSLDMRYTGLSTFNPSIPFPSSIRYIEMDGHYLSGFNPSIPLPEGLLYLSLRNGQLLTFNPTQGLPSTLRFLYLDSNNLTTFITISPLPDLEDLTMSYNNNMISVTLSGLGGNLRVFRAQNLKLPRSIVNSVLVYLDGIWVAKPGFQQVRLDGQNPPQAPNGAGSAAKSSLQSKAVSVITD